MVILGRAEPRTPSVGARIAYKFGAEIKFTLPESDDRQLALVKSSSPELRLSALTRSRGGRVVLEGRDWVVAELSLHDALEMRRLQGVAFVGGVSLDAGRFARFGELIGLTS